MQVNQKCNLTSTSHKNAKETFIFATILLFNKKNRDLPAIWRCLISFKLFDCVVKVLQSAIDFSGVRVCPLWGYADTSHHPAIIETENVQLRTGVKCKLARVLPKIFFVIGDGICHAGDICVSARHSAGDGPWWSFREFLALLRPEYGPSRWGRRIEQFYFITFQFLIFYREVGLDWSHLSKGIRGVLSYV